MTEAVSDTAERGPLRFTVKVSPSEVWLGDEITVSLDVHTPEDYLVRFPTVEDFGALEVAAEEARDPRPAPDGGLAWQQVFRITALHSGQLEIPPLVVPYARRPDEAVAQPRFEQELATGTLNVAVRSALTSQDTVAQPRDITDTLLPDKPPLTTRQWVYGAAAALSALLALYVLHRVIRRRLSRPVPPIPAELLALRALSDLAMTDLIETDPRAYYYRLSEIVRTYIERKFALAAPEMTTEEFLGTLARDRGALPYDAERLRAFLQACDIVKYAAFRPRNEDAEQALSTARAFVDATAAAARQTAVSVAGTDVTGGQAA
ncbi:MAG: hypothetical protein KKB50_07595 [Planctomycetes bacterium]|nr:hypothetical protein [Planctomycetota bacterium]